MQSDAVPFPLPLDTPAFRALWQEWLSYRKGRRLSCRPECLARQLKHLASFGVEVATEAVERSLRNGWQGLFPESIVVRTRPVQGVLGMILGKDRPYGSR